MILRFSALLFSVVLLTACSGLYKGKRLLKAGYIVPGDKNIAINPGYGAANDSIILHYFECGGFYVEHNGEAVLIDPFASNVSLTGPIVPKVDVVDGIMQRATGVAKGQRTNIRAILASHGHYDHLMDVPYIMDNWVDSTCMFAGNNIASKIVKVTTRNTIGRVVNLDAGGGQLYAGKHIRITPVLIAHPPMFGKKRFHDEDYKPNVSPSSPKFWQCGETYAYLIDFLDSAKQVKFRTYIQTSSSLLALDNIPADIKRQHGVDLMICAAALYSKAPGYPQKLISMFHPQHIIVCHWENFFKPLAKLHAKPYTVGLTNVYQFAKDLDYNVGQSRFTIPMPDTRIKVRF